MTDREAMELALEALESKYIVNYGAWRVQQDQAITALRQALETEQKPVAWMYTSQWKGNERFITTYQSELTTFKADKVWPLYTAPPKKQWVGLTDEEIDALSQARSLTDELMDCVDRLGSEADTVDPRVWQHLLVYAPKPEEEPVATVTSESGNPNLSMSWWHEPALPVGTKIYTSPQPNKQWHGLTDQEIEEMHNEIKVRLMGTYRTEDIYRSIEAKLREKNT